MTDLADSNSTSTAEVASAEYTMSSSDLLRDMWKEGAEPYMADITLRVGKEYSIKAHKNILGTRIPFFTQVFESGMREMEDGEFKFEEKEISAQSLDAIIRALYGQIAKITTDNVYDMHSAANFLQIEDLSVRCAEFMAQNLCVDTVISTWHYSASVFPGSDALHEACWEFMLANFLQLYERPDFLSNLDAAALTSLISRKDLGVSSENDVVDAVMTWVNFNWGERSQCTLELLENVHWDSVNNDCHDLDSVKGLRTRASDPATDSSAASVLITIGLQLLGLPKEAGPNQRLNTGISRCPKDENAEKLYVISGKDTKTCTVSIVDWKTQLCSKPKKLTGVISKSCRNVDIFCFDSSAHLLVLDNDASNDNCLPLLLYRLDGPQIMSKIDLIKPADLEVSGYRQVSYDKSRAQILIVFPDDMFIVYDLHNLKNEKPAIRETSQGSLLFSHWISSMKSERCGQVSYHRFAIADNKIWAIGCRKGSTEYTGVMSYDIVKQSWTATTPLLQSIGSDSIHTVSDHGLVIASRNGHVQILDLNTCCWKLVEKVFLSESYQNRDRELRSIFCGNDNLYVCGKPVERRWDEYRYNDAMTQYISIRAEGDWDERNWSSFGMLDKETIDMATFVGAK